MAEKVCPHCNGSGTNYVIATQDGKSMLQPVTCVVCNGKGTVTVPDQPPPPPPTSALVIEPELWPILVPLGIFFLFFAFLWV
jgi:hypothetical protein